MGAESKKEERESEEEERERERGGEKGTWLERGWARRLQRRTLQAPNSGNVSWPSTSSRFSRAPRKSFSSLPNESADGMRATARTCGTKQSSGHAQSRRGAKITRRVVAGAGSVRRG